MKDELLLWITILALLIIHIMDMHRVEERFLNHEKLFNQVETIDNRQTALLNRIIKVLVLEEK